MSRSGTAGSYGRFNFRFLRSLHTDFRTDYSNLHPSRESGLSFSAPADPHPSFCCHCPLIFAILIWVRWNLKRVILVGKRKLLRTQKQSHWCQEGDKEWGPLSPLIVLEALAGAACLLLGKRRKLKEYKQEKEVQAIPTHRGHDIIH